MPKPLFLFRWKEKTSSTSHSYYFCHRCLYFRSDHKKTLYGHRTALFSRISSILPHESARARMWSHEKNFAVNHKCWLKLWLHVQFLHALLLNCLQFLQRAAIARKNCTCNHSFKCFQFIIACQHCLDHIDPAIADHVCSVVMTDTLLTYIFPKITTVLTIIFFTQLVSFVVLDLLSLIRGFGERCMIVHCITSQAATVS